MARKVNVKIHYDRRSSVAALLVVAVLVGVFLAYLLWGQTRVAAGMEISRPAQFSRTARTAATGGVRQYYLTLSVAFDGAEALGACAAGYHMASVWELLDTSNLQYNTTLGCMQADSGYGPPSYFEGWVRTGYNNSTASTAGQANCGAWASASGGDYGTSLYLPRDWLAGQDLGTWKTGTWTCNTNLPVWCMADQNSGGTAVSGMRQYYLTQNDYIGSQPKTACATGYHMASLWETLDPSNLRYNVNLGYDREDIGMGPPTAVFGWVRTGYSSDNGSVSGSGQANCSAWSSGSAGNYGTVVRLPGEWTNTSQQDVSVWDVGLRECGGGAGNTAPAWCVADAADGVGTCSIPQSITCGQQVSGDTTGLASHHARYGCQPSLWLDESGPEVVYGLNLLAAFAPYTVTATLSEMSVDLDVFILSSAGCGAGECAAADSYGNIAAVAANVPGGTYYIAVDGYNGAAGSYTLSLACTSAAGPCTDLTSVTIQGEPSGPPGDYTFAAQPDPAASEPIGYLWDNGDTTKSSVRNLAVGSHTLVVTATNCTAGQATDDHTITIGAPPAGCDALTGVTISGPTGGGLNTVYTFTATVNPPTATLPITYTWSEPGSAVQGTASAQYTWKTAGSKTIAVNVQNCGAVRSATHDIDILHRIYLPLVLRNFR